MNKARSKKLQRIYEKLSSLEIKAKELYDQLEDLHGQEEKVFNGMSEKAQQSDKGYRSEQALNAMHCAMNSINALCDGSIDQLLEVTDH